MSVAGNTPTYIAETVRWSHLLFSDTVSLTLLSWKLQGWPTESMTAANATLGAAVAGVSELQTCKPSILQLRGHSPIYRNTRLMADFAMIVLDTYVCQANANQSAYFYFEPFDEPWKS